MSGMRFQLALITLLFTLLLAARADKPIKDLGLSMIDWIKPDWNSAHCDEWPEKDGSYKCKGTFYVHPNAINVKNLKH